MQQEMNIECNTRVNRLKRWWFWGRERTFYLKSKSFVCILSVDIVNEDGTTSDPYLGINLTGVDWEYHLKKFPCQILWTKSWIAEFKFVHYSCQTRYLPFPSANQVHESIVKVGENLKWRTWSGCISFAFQVFKFSRSQSEFKPQSAGWWPFSWLATYQLLTQWDPWSVFYDAYHQWMTAQLEARVSLLETTYGYSRIQLILVVLIRKLPGINISLKLRSTWQKKLYSLSKNLQSHWHDFSILIGCVICAILFFLYHFLLARIPATAGLHHIRSQDDTGNARWMEGPLGSTLLDFAWLW